jgi:hypothetical protein
MLNGGKRPRSATVQWRNDTNLNAADVRYASDSPILH